MEALKESLSPANILIVDDTPANLQFLATLFKSQGYKVRAALSGELAFHAIQAEPPDLILMDVRMPDLDGLEVCRRIKTNPELHDIPVIFLSGELDPVNRVKAFAAGGVDYVSRPFQIDELISRVTIHLDLQKQRQQLRDTMRHMKELETWRDTLIHMLIHDLRNPLFSIESYLGLLRTEEAASLTPQAVLFIKETETQAHTMLGMLNSILDVNRMEKGGLPFQITSCDLVDLCRQVIKGVEPLRGARSLTFTPAHSPIDVTIDVDLIRRLLTNLIANAIKATREEEGRIDISLTTVGGFARITVTDNGRLIPAEYHPLIFEKFSPGHTVLNERGRYAPGLGLPFCKLAAEAHGGRIGLETTPDGHNQFRVEIPLTRIPR